MERIFRSDAKTQLSASTHTFYGCFYDNLSRYIECNLN
jgi:hypothetical protein